MKNLWLVGVLLSAQCALACPSIDDAISMSADGSDAPAAYVSYPAPPVSIPFEIEVTFCDPEDHLVENVVFDATMPTHQHGMNYDPDVARIKNNLFRISNVVFHMPGDWEVKIEASIGGQRFQYTANIDVR